MNTRKALAKLSGGSKVYVDPAAGLLKNSQKFIDMYDAREREIIAKKNAATTPAPFLDVIKKKIAKMVQAPDVDMPLVARYDLYTGIRKMASRASNDNGLRKLSAQLERAWRVDPLGALTYGDVDGLVKLYRDQYPRSKAADAIEAECTRVGLHKLPVAKLARIAANIGTQADYDTAMEVNGYSGNRPEQIRARTLVRELVNMRGAKVASATPDEKDTRTAAERASDSLVRHANLKKAAGYQEAVQALGHASTLTEQMIKMMDEAFKHFSMDGLTNPANKASTLGKQFDSLLAKLTDFRDAEKRVTDPSPPSGLSEKELEDYFLKSDAGAAGINIKSPATKKMPNSAPPAKMDNLKDLDKQLDPGGKVEDEQIKNEYEHAIGQSDLEGAGMKRKWYDPRTWYHKAEKIDEIVRIASEIAAHTDGDFSNAMFAFARDMRRTASRISQIVPELEAPIEDPSHEMSETPAMEELEQETGIEMTPEPGAEVSPEAVNQGVDILENIEEAADEIIVEAPPEAMDYVQHEMGEGHSAPPGTAEWGAEEILNEGHEAPPPSDAWLDEELAEINHGSPTASKSAAELPKVVICPECKTLQRPGRPCGVCNYPDPAKAGITPENPAGVDRQWDKAGPMEPVRKWNASKGKGIPVPEKIKSQPNDKSLVDVPEDGAKALKASKIESEILSGNVVKNKTGSVKILVNANDEVELWHNGSGRVCDIADMDSAISDFINISAYERKAANTNANIELVDVVDVPCAKCASLVTFKHTASNNDQYVCSCGYSTNSSSVNTLIKLGHLVVRKVAQYQYSSKQYADLAMQVASRAKTTQEMYQMIMRISDKNKAIDPDVLKNKTLQVMESMKRKQVPQTQSPSVPRAPEQVTDDMIEPVPVVAQLQQPAAEPEVEEPVTDLPIDQVISSAFINYKAQNMPLPEAIRTFFKEHQDLVDSKWGPDADAALVAAQTQYYTANNPGVQAVPMQPAVPALDAAPPVAPAVPEAPAAAPAAPIAPAPASKKAVDSGITSDDVLNETILSAHSFERPSVGWGNDPVTSSIIAKINSGKALDPSELKLVMAAYNKDPNLQDIIAGVVKDWESEQSAKKQGQKIMEPSVTKKQKDSVSVGSKPLGKDSGGEDLLPSPGKIKTQQGKPSGKMSPTDLGEDSDSKDIELAKPKKTEPTRGKLPNKDMGKDSEPNDPFKTPALGK